MEKKELISHTHVDELYDVLLKLDAKLAKTVKHYTTRYAGRFHTQVDLNLKFRVCTLYKGPWITTTVCVCSVSV